MVIFGKVALYVALILCAFIIFIGVAIWFADGSFMQKWMASLFIIGAGVSLGSLGIHVLKEES